MFWSKCSTPCWPPAAKENKNIFPKLHAFAPAAKAFKTCVPLLTPPSKIIPVFLYALRAPFHEISGKLISTNAYLSNPKLSKIVPSHQINLNDNVYSNLLPTKAVNHSKDKDTIYLVKQNPCSEFFLLA